MASTARLGQRRHWLGLAPNEFHMGRLPLLPLIMFDRSGVADHQSLAPDHPAYCDLASERQQHANDI